MSLRGAAGAAVEGGRGEKPQIVRPGDGVVPAAAAAVVADEEVTPGLARGQCWAGWGSRKASRG